MRIWQRRESAKRSWSNEQETLGFERRWLPQGRGIFEEAQAQAVKEVVAWQLAEAMKKKKISKNKMATLLKTSRTQVDRLLNAKDDITPSSFQRAAAMVGRRVMIKLI
jgi:antitoxin HicB